jgi:hypothetical protein
MMFVSSLRKSKDILPLFNEGRLTRFDHTAYLVGGCVRDLLLERRPKDFDIATSATPRQVRRLFSNCRIIGRRFRLAARGRADGRAGHHLHGLPGPPADDPDYYLRYCKTFYRMGGEMNFLKADNRDFLLALYQILSRD